MPIIIREVGRAKAKGEPRFIQQEKGLYRQSPYSGRNRPGLAAEGYERTQNTGC
jgi:hypothetical protein